ncbi:hypothetical protein A3F02_00410 [Candidatus Curtissbacteria bacterium RIFCSPHIGHO2_12_FULL_38_9b]|uniref:Uncharacterized protein n=2 Tax=Candidatus Curtissiibacteriota TaxID=1752717 RepID=A0A1F5GZ56_9BACT|nr:MAG: hypothetical protein A3F02_00410 [Candidatus Curtissbacteria bacterium RIFCSPHIGHO2_12_FULL_38_9b]
MFGSLITVFQSMITNPAVKVKSAKLKSGKNFKYGKKAPIFIKSLTQPLSNLSKKLADPALSIIKYEITNTLLFSLTRRKLNKVNNDPLIKKLIPTLPKPKEIPLLQITNRKFWA